MEVRDPVCGMKLDDKTAPDNSTYDGTTYYFCSPDCKEAFDLHPEEYTTDIPQSSR